MSVHASQLGTVRLAAEEAQVCARLLAEGIPDDADGKKREQLVIRQQAALIAIIGHSRSVLADTRTGVHR